MVRHQISEQTRRRFAELSRKRQGVNGRWESNEKKAKFNAVKRASARLGPMMERCREKHMANTKQRVLEIQCLIRDLDAATSEAVAKRALEQLSSIKVTALILRKTSVPKLVWELSKRFPSVCPIVKLLLSDWRQTFRKDVAHAREAAQAPSLAVRVAKKAKAGPPLRSLSVSSTSSSSSGSSSVSSSSSSISTQQPKCSDQLSLVSSTVRKSCRPPKQSRITSFLSRRSVEQTSKCIDLVPTL